MKNIENNLKVFKQNKAITLVALVITIVVMLILAGVAIAAVVDGEGLFSKTRQATETYENATREENDKIQSMINQIDEILKMVDTTPGELAGEGTSDNPYKIESIEDLVAFSNNVNSGITYENEYVELERTLDFLDNNSYDNINTTVFGDINGDGIIEGLKEELTKESGKGFTPIGNTTFGFLGNFNGNLKEIKNLYINVTTDENVYLGLFGSANDICNLGVQGNIYGSTNGNMRAGMLVGTSARDSNSFGLVNIENCYTSGNIIINEVGGDQNLVGGVIGCANYAKISNCYNKSDINVDSKFSSYEGTGGITGFAFYYTSVIIDRCYNEGNINSTHRNIGGIIGKTDGIITNCYNMAESILCNGKTKGYCGVGGIIGRADEVTIYNCYNTSNVSGGNGGKGGIVGAMSGDDSQFYITMSNCYNISNSGNGIVGTTYSEGGTEYSISNVYYLEGGTDDYGEAKTEEQMKSIEFVNLLNSNIQSIEPTEDISLCTWKQDPNTGYPILQF